MEEEILKADSMGKTGTTAVTLTKLYVSWVELFGKNGGSK